VKADFISGKKYQLTIPKETVSSFFAKNYQSKRFDFEVDKVENFGSLKFILQNAPNQATGCNFWTVQIKYCFRNIPKEAR
jgi:hypothetical protein